LNFQELISHETVNVNVKFYKLIGAAIFKSVTIELGFSNLSRLFSKTFTVTKFIRFQPVINFTSLKRDLFCQD